MPCRTNKRGGPVQKHETAEQNQFANATIVAAGKHVWLNKILMRHANSGKVEFGNMIDSKTIENTRLTRPKKDMVVLLMAPASSCQCGTTRFSGWV